MSPALRTQASVPQTTFYLIEMSTAPVTGDPENLRMALTRFDLLAALRALGLAVRVVGALVRAGLGRRV